MAVRGKKSTKFSPNVIIHPKKGVVLIFRVYKNEQETQQYILSVDLVKLTFTMILFFFYYLYYSYIQTIEYDLHFTEASVALINGATSASFFL